MKKLILLLIFLIIIPSTLAICCQNIGIKEGGCYPSRSICCEETDKVVGYVGCKAALNPSNSNEFTYYCPSTFLGSCLKCSSNCKSDGTDCNWEEVDKCSGLSCVIGYLSGTKIPSMVSECSAKCGEGEIFDEEEQECIEVENINDATCTNDMCMPNKWCCNKNGKFEQGQTTLCSGDNDKDEICNYYDNCEEIVNLDQKDSDNDGIGDACEFEDSCESAYGDRQCCDLLEGATNGVGQDFGKTEDCPGLIGCFSECIGTTKDSEGNVIEIRYEISPCIDGKRTVKKLQGTTVIETKTEACSGIPLIPFFTNINLIFTFIILFLYYFKER